MRRSVLIPPFALITGVWESSAQGIVEAREQGEFLSVEDLQQRARISRKVIEVLDRLGCLKGGAGKQSGVVVLENIKNIGFKFHRKHN